MQNDMDTRSIKLGLPAMDQSHEALLSEMTELGRATDSEFIRCYPALVASIERDFREEEALMEEVGVETFQAHLEQHARVLGALHHAAASLRGGDTGPAREALTLFPQWLLFHIFTLDKALAEQVQAKRTHGTQAAAMDAPA